jgi:hypothetical protein
MAILVPRWVRISNRALRKSFYMRLYEANAQYQLQLPKTVLLPREKAFPSTDLK